MVHRSLYDANASPGFLFGENVFLSMKKFQGGVFLFCDALSAESEGSSGPYENLKLTALLCCCFSLSQYKIM